MNSQDKKEGYRNWDGMILMDLEGLLDEPRRKELHEHINQDPHFRQYFIEFVGLCAILRKYEHLCNDSYANYVGFDEHLWKELSIDQKIAPTEEIAPTVKLTRKKTEELIFNVRQRKQELMAAQRRHRINTSFLAVTFGSIAAILFMVVYLNLVPSHSPVPVATVIDSINARYSDDQDIVAGSRLAGRTEPYRLTCGTLSVQFDYGAEVMIEGPAEFEIHTAGKMFLKSGMIYAVVPGIARGFMVDTPSVSVIDLGTEFGIKTDIDGTSDVHLFKGRAAIIPVVRKNTETDSQLMTEQSALRIDTEGMISTISCEPAIFPHAISSKTHMVWRGQSVDLSDILGGGNGFGTGVSGQWLDVMTGRAGGWLSKKLSKTGGVCTDYQYHRVEHLAGVDGVFLPNGDKGPIQVTSAGDLWKDVPETKGICFENITNSQVVKSGIPHTLTAHGRSYGTRQHPAIAIHPNIGITFDLVKIRSGLPENVTGMCFRAGCALSSEAEYYGDADFWVLVDGQTRFSVKQITAKDGLRDIDVPLALTDRFLTLVSTDGDLDPASDWAFFAEPRLEIQRQ